MLAHSETCHYRLKRDTIVVKLEFREDELLAALYLTQRLNAIDHDTFVTMGGEALHSKLHEATKALAALKSTGQLPKEG